MRLIYFSRDYSTHDHRFLSALGRSDDQIFYLQLERRGHTLEDRPLPSKVEHIQWAGGQKPVRFNDGPRLLADLRRVIKKVNPDVILAGPIQRSAFLVALAGFGSLVSMSWGYDLLMDANRNLAWHRATRYTLRHSAALVGDCDTIRQIAISFGMQDENIVTFPWGVDLHHYHATPLISGQTGLFTLLSTRGWERIYGVEIIARAFVKVAKEHPEIRLVMLGNGSQAKQLHEIFTRGGVMNQVLLPGQVSQNDLPRYYQMADVYISASHSDGSSISLLEAMACGRPVLVSDIPGNREWVRQGENGWCFKDGNSDSLAEGIQNAFQQRPRLPEMGAAARQTAETRADWEKNFPLIYQAFGIAIKR